MILFTLRREQRLSGEGASTRLLEEVLGELGIACDRPVELPAFRRVAQLRRVARQNASDTLLVKMPTAAQLPLAAWATREFRGRVVHWIDGLLWRTLPLAQSAKLLMAEPLLSATRAMINTAAWLPLARTRALEIVVASHTQRAEIARLLPYAKIHVIPNGSPSDEVANGARREDASYHHDLASSTPAGCTPRRIGYLGHAYLTKGVWDLLAAHRLLRARGIAVPLVLALSGLGGARFRRAAARAGIEVFGKVNPREFFASIDVLVAPLWAAWGTQTFPNVLLEALEAGLPVVTSDLPVCRELFADSLAVFVPPHNPAALAETLARVHAGAVELPASERLRAHFQAHYSKARIAEGWRAILQASS